MAKNRAYTISNILDKKFNLIELPEDFKKSLGSPDRAFSATVWGLRSNGKTEFTIKLAKALTEIGRVDYNSLEEGFSHTFQMAIERNHMTGLTHPFTLLDKEPFMTMWERLTKPKSAKVIIIDSVQVTKITKTIADDFMTDMKKRRKSVIWVSQAKGKEPKGELADHIAYMSDIKISVEGFRAFPEGRLNGGGEPYTIWPEKAAKYWNEIK